MGSSLQLLRRIKGGKSSVLFTTKMKFLIFLLSATLVYGAANPGYGHAYHNGPHCHDKKEHQCHKHPKENTRKIPKQTCKKIVDTIYIEECEERIHTHCEETHERGHHSTRVVDHHSDIIASSSHSGHQESHGGGYHH